MNFFLTPSFELGGVQIDCLISEEHSSSISITDNPVERGADIQDHASIEPKSLSLQIATAGAAGAYASLLELQESREAFDLVSGLKIYPSMLIESINVTRDKTSSEILGATLECREVQFADTASVSVDVDDTGNRPQGQPAGVNSNRAAPPDPSRATDQATADRASPTIQRGDATGTAH